MHLEADIIIERPRADVFEWIAHAERLPDYVTDFAWVKQLSTGAPGPGTEYGYKMVRGATEGTFAWTEFTEPSRLAWHGPPAKSGPGSMEPSGWWDLSEENGATRVKLVMTPKPGGVFKLLSPMLTMGMRQGNGKALQKLKLLLEDGAGA